MYVSQIGDKVNNELNINKISDFVKVVIIIPILNIFNI
jgi:hypothetical protein